MLLTFLRPASLRGAGSERPPPAAPARGRGRGAGNRETGNGEPGTGNREPGTGNRKPRTGNREQGARNREQGAGNRDPLEPPPVLLLKARNDCCPGPWQEPVCPASGISYQQQAPGGERGRGGFCWFSICYFFLQDSPLLQGR